MRVEGQRHGHLLDGGGGGGGIGDVLPHPVPIPQNGPVTDMSMSTLQPPLGSSLATTRSSRPHLAMTLGDDAEWPVQFDRSASGRGHSVG